MSICRYIYLYFDQSTAGTVVRTDVIDLGSDKVSNGFISNLSGKNINQYKFI